MPNRIIRECCRSSPTLDQLSAQAERLFWRLTTVADDYGRFEADPRLLLSACFPLAVDRWKPTTVADWFEELVSAGAVAAYTVEGRVYGVYLTWNKHQRSRTSKPKYPAPLEDIAATRGESPPLAANCRLARAYGLSREPPRQRRRALRQNLKIKSKKQLDPTTQKQCAEETSNDLANAFDRFWKAYPPRKGRRDGKAQAAAEYRKLAPDGGLQVQMLFALERYAAATELPVDAVRWLKYRRWEDEDAVRRPVRTAPRAPSPAAAIPDEKPARSREEVSSVASILDSLPWLRK